MAALSKGALRTLTRALLKDQEKNAWSDSVLDIVIRESIDSLASQMLDFAPFFISNSTIIQPSSFSTAGTYDLTQLTLRFYKMQSVVNNGQMYNPTSVNSVVLDPSIGSGASSVMTSPQFSYYIRGNALHLFPLDVTLQTPTTVMYNYLPIDYLTQADTDSVDWPDGFEMLIAHDAALQIVDDEFRTTKFQNLRNERLDSLYSKIKRQYVGPAVQNGIDDMLSWGSI